MASGGTIIAILIPGLTATNLTDSNGNPIIATALDDAIAGNTNQGIAELDSTTFTVGPPTGWDSGQAYGSLQAYLGSLGFASTAITSASGLPSTFPSRYLIGFGYDWREENDAVAQNGQTYGTAQTLIEILAAIDDTMNGAPYQTWLIGHSMGGLVARAALETQLAAAPSWYAKVAGLITLGTPHFGAPLALTAILGQFIDPLAPLNKGVPMMVAQFLNDNGNPDWDAPYELLPPPSQAFIRFEGSPKSAFDLSSQLVEKGASQEFLTEAQTFFGRLIYSNEPGLPPYYCVWGIDTDVLNPTIVGYSVVLGLWKPTPAFSGGDGIVPSASAQFAGRDDTERFQAQANGSASHVLLPTYPDVQAYIAQTMNVS